MIETVTEVPLTFLVKEGRRKAKEQLPRTALIKTLFLHEGKLIICMRTKEQIKRNLHVLVKVLFGYLYFKQNKLEIYLNFVHWWSYFFMALLKERLSHLGIKWKNLHFICLSITYFHVCYRYFLHSYIYRKLYNIINLSKKRIRDPVIFVTFAY